MNPLGLPETVDAWWGAARWLRRRAAGRSLRGLIRQAGWDERVTRAVGRWPILDDHGVEPTPRRPVDILALRADAARLDLAGMAGMAPPSHAGALAAPMLDARPHWLAAGMARAVAESDPPPADEPLRLPWPEVSLWWEQPAEVGMLADLAPPGIVGALTEAGNPATPWELASPCGLFALDDPRDDSWVTLDGVVVLGDHDGQLEPFAVWVLSVSVPADSGAAESRTRPLRTVAPCALDLCELRHVVEGMAAVVAYGHWRDVPARDRPAPGADRRELRQWLRRHDPNAVSPVRVLDAGKRPSSGRSGGGTHASPVAHARKGHYRRQYHPSTDDHEVIWIPPTVVNPHGLDGERITVWRL